MNPAFGRRQLRIFGIAAALAIALTFIWRSGRHAPSAYAPRAESFAPKLPDTPLYAATLNPRPAQAAAQPAAPVDREAYRQALASFQSGRDSEAISRFERVVRRNPRLAIGRAYLGLAYVRAKRFDDAMKQFEAERDLLPNPAFAWAHIADVHYARGKLPAAIDALETAARLKPDLAQVHFNLGVLYPQALELGKGLEALDRYLALEPQNHYAHYLRGNLLYKLTRLDEAEAALGEAIRLSPQTGLYHFGLGQVFLRRKVSDPATEHAISEFRLALDLHAPEPAAVHYQLGVCYQRKRNWDAAGRELQTSTEMAPEAWGAFYALADVLQRQGRMEEAGKARTRFARLRAQEDLRMQRSFHAQEVERNPSSAEARYQLAAFLAKQGERQAALKAAGEAGRLSRGPRTDPALRRRIAALSTELSARQSRR